MADRLRALRYRTRLFSPYHLVISVWCVASLIINVNACARNGAARAARSKRDRSISGASRWTTARAASSERQASLAMPGRIVKTYICLLAAMCSHLVRCSLQRCAARRCSLCLNYLVGRGGGSSWMALCALKIIIENGRNIGGATGEKAVKSMAK